MARARNIKPGFFRDVDLLELPIYARHLFIGLWTLCDRAGRMEDKPKQIKLEIFPMDAVDCDDLLNQLDGIGVIKRYEVDGKRYLQVVNFTKHQNPHRDEKPSTIPEYIEHGANTVQAPCNSDADTVAIGLNPESGFLNPESQMDTSATAPPTPKKAKKNQTTPLPDNFEVSDRVKTWAKRKGFAQLDEHLEAFIGKAKAKAYTYADWDEGFMGAIREDWAKLRTPRGYQPADPSLTVPSKPGIDPALAKCLADAEICKPPPPEIRARMKELSRAAA